jgi:hypothetical protein
MFLLIINTKLGIANRKHHYHDASGENLSRGMGKQVKK